MQLKNTVTEMKSSVNGLNRIMEMTEERINELENRTEELNLNN